MKFNLYFSEEIYSKAARLSLSDYEDSKTYDHNEYGPKSKRGKSFILLWGFHGYNNSDDYSVFLYFYFNKF